MGVVDFIGIFFATVGTLFGAPLKQYEMLWIIIPVYINWIFTEFYQEKKGTSFGNAVTNGFVALWVGIDWLRTTVEIVSQKVIKTTFLESKITVAALMGIYGVTIIVMGIKGKHTVKLIGRIREVTYLTVMLTPIFYGAVHPTWTVIISIVLFFPLFYGIVELVNYFLPNPKTYDEWQRDSLHTSRDGTFESPVPPTKSLEEWPPAGNDYRKF